MSKHRIACLIFASLFAGWVLIPATTAHAADASCFVVTDEALLLARKLKVNWNDLLFAGAPGIDIRQPYGSKEISADIKRILKKGDLPDDRARALHADTLRTFQILIRFGKLTAGTYELQCEKKRVAVSADELKLQKTFNFQGDPEHGEFGIDAKRPYGDRKCWELDMADAIGLKSRGDETSSCEESFLPAEHKRLAALHEETLDFVRVLLEHAQLAKRRFAYDDAMVGFWSECGQR